MLLNVRHLPRIVYAMAKAHCATDDYNFAPRTGRVTGLGDHSPRTGKTTPHRVGAIHIPRSKSKPFLESTVNDLLRGLGVAALALVAFISGRKT